MIRSLILVLLFLLSGCSSKKLAQKRTDKLSILQGLTTAKEVEFSIVAPGTVNLKFELRTAGGEIIIPDESKKISRASSPWVIHKMVFSKDQGQDYNLYVFENGRIIDQRLVGRGQQSQSALRVAVVSCLDDTFTEQFKIWDILAHKNPEYLLMIGDNVYADINPGGFPGPMSAERLWNRYTDTRLTLPFFFQEKLIPTHALWDDHDYGQNDSNEEFELKAESKEIFEAFFAQSLSDETYTKGIGVGGLLTLGDFNLYFLDGRTHRAAKKDGRHLGLEQHDWLMKSLKEESQPSFIIKGDQFFGGYHTFQSYEGNHPEDFSIFVKDLNALKTPFVFLSGDRHMSEIMQFPRSLFGLPSFEITSSPIHGKVYPPADTKNHWRVVATEGKVNFTVIDNLAKDNHWFLNVENIGETGEVYYRRELAVYIKDLQNNLQESRKRRSGKQRRYRRIRPRGRRRR